MPYNPLLNVRPTTERAIQTQRYFNLARFMDKVSVFNGKHPYTVAALRKSLAASHVLNKNGMVNQKRLENWARARGIKPKHGFTTSPSEWQDIVEGES